jgi:hypothetical protein
MATEGTVIAGRAYAQPATLEVSGDTLTWRARRGQPDAENIVTTVHDVREALWVVQRWSFSGLAIAVLGASWAVTRSVPAGAVAFGLGASLVAWRRFRPRQLLVLEVGDRTLVLQVALGSGAAARALVARIDRAQASGELPATPPTLP